jgi:hypothetical protein
VTVTGKQPRLRHGIVTNRAEGGSRMDKHIIHNNPLTTDEENRKPGITVKITIPFLNSEESQDC